MLILPGIEFAAEFPGAPDYASKAAISATEPALELAVFVIVPA